MTRPTSRLEWWPDVRDPHAIRARWIGAPWHYTLEWGHLGEDGKPATDSVMFWQVIPVRHAYPKGGRYTLIGRPGLTNSTPTSVVVTLRDKLNLEATFELLDDGRSVKATLERHDDNVRYQIEWGDGRTTEHDVHDLAPVHEYPWGLGKPKIKVTDLPARRTATFTGPEIGPQPGPHVIDGFYFDHTPSEENPRRFTLRGGGLEPGDEITWYPWHVSWYRDVVADTNGQIHDTIDIPASYWSDWDVWRSYTVSTPTGRVHVPLHAPRAVAGEPDVTYQIHVDGDPKKVEISATPAMLGSHDINFGDGKSTTVEVTALPLRARHTYTGSGPYTVTVTLPDGRTATGRVQATHPCPPCYNENYPGRCAIDWWITGNWCGRCGGDSDAYAPVMIDNGFHPPHQLHKTCEGSPWHTGYGYGGFPAGWYTFEYRTALEPAANHQVYIAKTSKIKRPGGAWIEENDVKGDYPPPSNPLTQTFHVGETSTPGRYTARFQITNNGDVEVPWQLDVTLAAPAVLADVQSWVGTATKTDLGGGRWRITCDRPARVKDPWPVEITVDPCGDPRVWPTEVSLTVPTAT